MINPFVSINQQLEDIGYVRQYEGQYGFIFAKNVGGGYVHLAEALAPIEENKELKIRFYDPHVTYNSSVQVSAKELALFSKKLKEWKEQYERTDNN